MIVCKKCSHDSDKCTCNPIELKPLTSQPFKLCNECKKLYSGNKCNCGGNHE